MRVRHGNILDVESGIIIQQVNCKGVMGAGLAKQIRSKWEKVYDEYIKHLEAYNKRGLSPLGTISRTTIEDHLQVCNFYAQGNYGRSGRHTDYEAFEKCLAKLKNIFVCSKVTEEQIPVYFPYKIGCGLAGGEWSTIVKLISKYFPSAVIVMLKEEK